MNKKTRDELLESIVQNWVDVAQGNLDHEQAIRNVARESGEKITARAASYIKAKMSESGSDYLRTAAQTDIVDSIVSEGYAALTDNQDSDEAIRKIKRQVGNYTAQQAATYAKDKLNKSGNAHLQAWAESEVVDSLANNACSVFAGDMTADEAWKEVGGTVEREALQRTISFAKGKMGESGNSALRSLGESKITDTAIVSGYSYLKGDIDGIQAVENLVDAGIDHYTQKGVTAWTQSAVQGAKNPLVKSMSKSNLPAMVAEVAMNMKGTFSRYLHGDISGVECFEELGQRGADTLCASMGTVLGQIAIPIPVVGALAGNLLGYALSSASYGALRNDLQTARLARERREIIHEQCEARIKMMRQFRAQFERDNARYLRTRDRIFSQAISRIDAALELGDIDSLLAATSAISVTLGNKTRPSNLREVNALMKSDAPFRL